MYKNYKIDKLAVLLLFLIFFDYGVRRTFGEPSKQVQAPLATAPPIATAVPMPTVSPKLISIPETYQIAGGTQVFQTFNNCGPASLSMALSFFGINVSQQTLGNELRPWQNSAGDNDDKSVTLPELAEKASQYGFITYHRPNGDIETLKKFIANDIPVVTRTLLEPGNDIGHYRVIYGYDSLGMYQNDSLQGANLRYNNADFLEIWKPFGYEFLTIIPKEKEKIAAQILGEDIDAEIAWKKSVENLRSEITRNPNDIFLKFSLSVAYYETGEYQKSVEQFEEIEQELPFRTLWYQIEPLLAYQKLGRYNDLLPRIQNILDNHNRAFSELYQIRGEIYLEQGDIDKAREQFELAVLYNKNFKPSIDALSSL